MNLIGQNSHIHFSNRVMGTRSPGGTLSDSDRIAKIGRGWIIPLIYFPKGANRSSAVISKYSNVLRAKYTNLKKRVKEGRKRPRLT